MPDGFAAFAIDAFKESDHPRSDDGKFGSGGGSSGSGKTGRLTSKEKVYLDLYSGDHFFDVNRKLREGWSGDEETKAIDSALNKSTLPATKLYRKIDRDAAKKLFGEEVRKGQVVSDPAYASTSKSAGAWGLGGVVLNISTHDGQHGIDMNGLTRNPNENEILLPRNTRMEVTGITPPSGPGQAVHVHVRTVSGDKPAKDQQIDPLHRTLADLLAYEHWWQATSSAEDEFKEADHQRDVGGQFTSGSGGETGGGGSGGKEAAAGGGANPTVSIESFRSAPNYVEPRSTPTEGEVSGRLPLANSSATAVFADPDLVPYLEKRSERTGKNEIREYLGGATYDELHTIATDPRFELKEPVNAAFGIDDSGMAALETQIDSGEIKLNSARYVAFDPERAANYAGKSGGAVFTFTAPTGSRMVFTEAFDLPEGAMLPGASFKVKKDTPADGDKPRHVELELTDDGSEGIKALTGGSKKAQDAGALAQDADMAFDRSVRTYDANGHLHVANSNISKANICEYYGREIPDADKLGLDPERRYRLYRDPDELAKAVPTFNRLPVFIEHQPTSADSFPEDLIVGTTGSDAAYEHPFLRNSLSIWRRDAIDGIERDDRKQLSAAYRYRADMTPGAIDNQHYDGVMRDIQGNHVALVPEGRAGADVVVGDSKPQESIMPAARTAPRMSRQALYLSAACAAYFQPKLAADQRMPDMRPLMKGLTHKTWADKAKRSGVETAITKAVKSRLAADASMADFHDFLDGFSGGPAEGELSDQPLDPKDASETVDAEPFEGEETPDEELLETDTPAGKLMAFLQSVLTPEELAQAKAIAQGGGGAPPDNNEQPNPEPDPTDDQEPATPEDNQRRREGVQMDKIPPATGMDAKAVDRRIDAAVKVERERAIALRDAERDVRSLIGDLQVAMDSAADVYKYALDQRGVEVDEDCPSTAYRTLWKMHVKTAEEARRHAPANNIVAMDAAERQSFDERFPTFGRLKHA